MNDIHIVTVATHMDFYLPYLIESCKRNGKELEILGFGEKWQGLSWKFQKMIDYLQTLDKKDIVCFVDGYDVICNRNINELKEIFITFKNKNNFKFLTAIDIYKYYIQEYVATLYFKKCKNNNLNTGTYIGYSNDLLDVLKKLEYNTSNDDQILLTEYCNMHQEDVYIDFKQDLFLTIHKPLSDIHNEVIIKNNIAYYNNKQPFFIHAPSCTYLNKMIIQLGYNITDHSIIEYKLKHYFFRKGKVYVIDVINRYYLIILTIIIIIILYIYNF